MYKKRCRESSCSASSSSFILKKGQVSLFVILGILLVLALALVIVTRSELFSFGDEVAPTDTAQVSTFLTSCIQQVGDEALFLVGLQGGHIDLDPTTIRDQSQSVSLSPMHAVPFWAHGPDVAIPTLDEIRERINLHLERNVPDCFFNEDPFSQTYDITERSPITADTVVTPAKVIFNVDWDLEVRTKQGEVETQIREHAAESVVKLGRLHEIASRIMEEELRTLKLEDITQDLIAFDHPSVPVNGLEISCSEKRWKVSEVKETLQDMLRVNVGQLKVKGTKYDDFPDEFPYYQNHYVWDVGPGMTDDVSVRFRYNNDFPTTFQVTPSEGNWLRSGSAGGTDLLSFFCMQTWKFTYDVVYPVIVTVRDDAHDYDFNFAFTVHLVNNFPGRDRVAVARESNPVRFADSEVFCQNKRVPMSVKTWERIDNGKGVGFTQPLGEVDVSYTCLRYKCGIGSSQVGGGYQADVTRNFPYCVGGILRGVKEGYMEDWTRVTTEPGAEHELFLTPLIDIPLSKFTVLQHDRDTPDMEGQPLQQGQTALLRVSHYRNGEKFHDIQQIVSSLNPALYGALRDDIIEDEERRQQVEEPVIQLLDRADFEYVVEIDVLSDNELIGGYRGNWTAPIRQLETAEEVVFHVITDESGSSTSQFELMLGLHDFSTQIPAPEVRS